MKQYKNTTSFHDCTIWMRLNKSNGLMYFYWDERWSIYLDISMLDVIICICTIKRLWTQKNDMKIRSYVKYSCNVCRQGRRISYVFSLILRLANKLSIHMKLVRKDRLNLCMVNTNIKMKWQAIYKPIFFWPTFNSVFFYMNVWKTLEYFFFSEKKIDKLNRTIDFIYSYMMTNFCSNWRQHT